MIKRFLLVLCLLPTLAIAAEDQPSDGKGWSGEGAFGFTSSSGNTDTQNLNAALSIARQSKQWNNSLALDAIRNEADSETSADRWSLRRRSEYVLAEKSYSFGQARYEEDEFSGYSESTSLAVGLGSRFIENDKHLLDLSAGVGYRNLVESNTGDSEDGGIVTSDLVYEFKISESTTFSEVALIEAGADNTFIQSVTALRSKISGSLSSQISYLVQHNSDVSPNIENTDQIITISLVYGF
jgi:putative salt-induced outer membrane protein